MERRLAAIVCADVAGYSRMMGADEAGTHATFKAHRTAIYPIILNHGGRLVKNTGDGFLLEFPSIVGAIEAAIAMQMADGRTKRSPARRPPHAVPDGHPYGRRDGRRGRGVRRRRQHRRPPRIGRRPRRRRGFGQGLPRGRQAPQRRAGRCRPPPLQEHRRADQCLDLGAGRTPAPCAAEPDRNIGTNLPAQYRTAIVGVLPFANLERKRRRIFFRRPHRGPDPRAVAAIVLPGAEPQLDVLVQGQEREHAPDRARDRRDLPDPGLGAARRDQDSRHRRADRARDRRAIMDRPVSTATSATCSRCRTNSPPACRRRSPPEIYRAEASAPPRSSSNDLTAWDRFLKGLSYYYLQTKADFETSIGLFKEAIALDPTLSIARAYLATIHDSGHPVRMDQEHARIVGRRDEPRGKQRPARSSFILCVSDPGLSARDRRALRGGDGCRQAGGRTESVRHGRPRRAWHFVIS